MTLSIEERSAINRKNGARSRGPSTEEGKARSRQNALKHGLRAEVLALPNEDPDVVRIRQQAWQDYYMPYGPAAQHLVNQCVRATLLADRCDAYHTAALASQMRQAEEQWEYARLDEVERLAALLPDDPATAVRLLKRSGHGCRWLIARWERLEQRLDDHGSWLLDDRCEAIRLLGVLPEPGPAREAPDRLRVPDPSEPARSSYSSTAFLIHLFSVICQPDGADATDLERLFDPSRMPQELRASYRVDALPQPSRCREALRALVAEQLAALRPEEARLHEEIDEPERVEASQRASIVLEEGTARLFLRYHAEARTAFHRAYRELIPVLKYDVSSNGANPVARRVLDHRLAQLAVVDPGADAPPPPSPNEPNPEGTAVAEVSGRDHGPTPPAPESRVETPAPPTLSPNEPNPAALPPPTPAEPATDRDARSEVASNIPEEGRGAGGEDSRGLGGTAEVRGCSCRDDGVGCRCSLPPRAG